MAMPKTEMAAKKSLGLLGMRERALILGGTVDIRGAAGRGTIVKVHMPLPAVPGTSGGMAGISGLREPAGGGTEVPSAR